MRVARYVAALTSAAGMSVPAGGASPPGAGGQPAPRPATDEVLPRHLTPAEREYLRRHPFGPDGPDVPTPPPTGPVHCPAEYEPMEALIIAWEGLASWNSLQAQMARHITTTGNAELHVVCDSTAVQSSATGTLAAAGTDMSRVRFFIRTLDSIWVRDYGPRYIYEGNCRAVVDHRYNRPRPNDDVLPPYYAQVRRHAFYELGLNGTTLVHGGGNFHLDALGRSYATRLVNNENPWFTEPQIISIWRTYQNVETTLFNPFPTSVDATQHIDMWMQVYADDGVIISDWPSNPGSVQDQICDQAAALMQSRGYTVVRVPAFSIGGVHYTYTNMVLCNTLVMVPVYNQATVQPYNSTVLATLQAAMPGRTVLGMNCDAIIPYAGAIHCIVMHVPVHRGLPGPGGGLAPTAYLRGPNGGETFTPGSQVEIRWISDDDAQVVSADLRLSLDGGQTFPTVIAAGIPDAWTYTWTVPQVHTLRARVRVVVRDAAGNTGYDDSDVSFTIGSPCYANCDGSTAAPVLNVADFTCFLQAFAAGDLYANCDDSTAAPVLNVADFTCFLQQFAAGCP